jgi:hypothetical protein
MKKSKYFRILLLTVGIIFLVLLFIYSKSLSLTKSTLDEFTGNQAAFSNTIDKFLDDVKSNKVDDAYQLTDGTMSKDALSNPKYQALIKKYIKQAPDQYARATAISLLSGKKLIAYMTDAYFEGNILGQIETTFYDNNGVWQIDSLQIATPPDKLW